MAVLIPNHLKINVFDRKIRILAMDLRGLDCRDHLKMVLIFFRKRALCKNIVNYQNFDGKILVFLL